MVDISCLTQIVVLTFIGIAIWQFYVAADNEKTGNAVAGGIFTVLALAMLILTICLPGSVWQVDTGTVAVVRHLGKIEGIRQPGTYVDFYMTNKYEVYDTKVQQDKIVTAAYSKDGQTMELEVFLQYQVQAEHIMDIATQYGSLDALQSRIETQTIEKTKAVIPVDIAGKMCDYERIFEAIENKKHLFRPENDIQRVFNRVVVVADSAHGFGSSRHGVMSGGVADFTAFSFNLPQPRAE